MDEIRMNLLKEVADLDALPVGAYNIRENGKAAGRNTTANIDIVTKLFPRPASRTLCITISTSARTRTS